MENTLKSKGFERLRSNKAKPSKPKQVLTITLSAFAIAHWDAAKSAAPLM